MCVVVERTTPNLYQTRSARSLADGVSRLRFGKMVDKVIPYLPMDPASNLLIIELKLQRLADTLPGGMYTTSGKDLTPFGNVVKWAREQ